MSVASLTNGCKSATLELSNYELTVLQMSCMDRITNLRAFIQGAEARSDHTAQSRLKVQLSQVEDLLARLVQL
jgi:hypothetical protein